MTANTDEIYRSLISLFGIFKAESEKEKYYVFSLEDLSKEDIDLTKRETASTPEEGLHQYGNLIYLALTGKDGNKERSIKIDGYPKLNVFFWPILEALLVPEKPTIEMVEEKMRETEEGSKHVREESEKISAAADDDALDEKKAVDILSDMFGRMDENSFERIITETRKRLYPKPPRKTRLFRDADGVMREFDTSPEACEPFGFFSGERIYSPEEGSATVIGVCGGNLWSEFDRYKGEARYWGSHKTKADFERKGIRLVNERKPQLVKYSDYRGRTTIFDVSEEACAPYGFYAGDRIYVPGYGHATVLGVSNYALWYEFDSIHEAHFWGSNKKKKELEEAGFARVARPGKTR